MTQYLKQDCELGYIEDNAEIENLKFNNLRHVVLNCLLGDFDETGAYVVDKQIINELILMPKYIVETLDNIEICRGELKLDKHISFIVTFEGNKATLSLIEKVNFESNFKLSSGTYSNIIETMLDQVETSGVVNRNVLYKRWNIGAFGGNVIDIFNCDSSVLEKYLGIVNRFKYLLESNKVLLEKEEEIEEIESFYANEMMDVIKHYPKLKDAVDKQIKNKLSTKKELLNSEKPNFAKAYNEILNNALENNLDVLSEKEKEDFNVEKRNVVVATNIKKEDALNIVETENLNNNKPNVVKMKVSNSYQTRTVLDLASEVASATSGVLTRLSSKENQKTDKRSEKDKLLTTLISAGFGSYLAGPVGAVAGAIIGNMVAEAAQAVIPAHVEKKPEVKKQEKKPENKTEGKQEKKPEKKTETKQEKKPEKKTEVKQEKKSDKNDTQAKDGKESKIQPAVKGATLIAALNKYIPHQQNGEGDKVSVEIKARAVKSSISDGAQEGFEEALEGVSAENYGAALTTGKRIAADPVRQGYVEAETVEQTENYGYHSIKSKRTTGQGRSVKVEEFIKVRLVETESNTITD